MGAGLGNMSPESMALSAAASAGFNALIGMGTQALSNAFSSNDDRVSSDTYAVLLRLSERVSLVGTDEVGGRAAWILRAEDPAGLDVGGEDFAPTVITFSMDQDDYVILAVEMQGEIEMDGERRPTTIQVLMEDYREVGGMLQPFRTALSFEGLGQAIPDGEREEIERSLAEARAQFGELEAQLAQLPPQQRRMMEQQLQAMGGISGLQETMERQMGALGAGRMETVVTRMHVNEGPPEELTADRR